jgi:hypothetical protein
VIGESNSAGVLLQSRPLPEPHPNELRAGQIHLSPRLCHRRLRGGQGGVPWPAELAVRTGIEPVSLHGQWSCLTRCIADLTDSWAPPRLFRQRASLPRDREGRERDPDWCVWPDSNGHCMRSQRTPSAYWGTDAWKNIAKFVFQYRIGGPGWIQTNAGRTPGRLRGGCRRSLGYWSAIIVGCLRDAPPKSAVGDFDAYSAQLGKPDLGRCLEEGPELEDTVGLAPTLRRLRASRVKSPVRSLLRSRVRNGICLRCSLRSP